MSNFTFSSIIEDSEYPEYTFYVTVEEPFFPIFRRITVVRLKHWRPDSHHPYTVTAKVEFFVVFDAADRINRMMDFMRNNIYGIKDCDEKSFRSRLKLGLNHYDKNVKVYG